MIPHTPHPSTSLGLLNADGHTAQESVVLNQSADFRGFASVIAGNVQYPGCSRRSLMILMDRRPITHLLLSLHPPQAMSEHITQPCMVWVC